MNSKFKYIDGILFRNITAASEEQWKSRCDNNATNWARGLSNEDSDQLIAETQSWFLNIEADNGNKTEMKKVKLKNRLVTKYLTSKK
jgi:hypothetical protein